MAMICHETRIPRRRLNGLLLFLTANLADTNADLCFPRTISFRQPTVRKDWSSIQIGRRVRAIPIELALVCAEEWVLIGADSSNGGGSGFGFGIGWMIKVSDG